MKTAAFCFEHKPTNTAHRGMICMHCGIKWRGTNERKVTRRARINRFKLNRLNTSRPEAQVWNAVFLCALNATAGYRKMYLTTRNRTWMYAYRASLEKLAALRPSFQKGIKEVLTG